MGSSRPRGGGTVRGGHWLPAALVAGAERVEAASAGEQALALATGQGPTPCTAQTRAWRPPRPIEPPALTVRRSCPGVAARGVRPALGETHVSITAGQRTSAVVVLRADVGRILVAAPSACAATPEHRVDAIPALVLDMALLVGEARARSFYRDMRRKGPLSRDARHSCDRFDAASARERRRPLGLSAWRARG